MHDSFTAGALRALARARARARDRGASSVEPIDLLAALADEEESRASKLLSEFGFDPVRLCRALGVSEVSQTEEVPDATVPPLPQSFAVRSVLNDASVRAHALDLSRLIGTEHLLAGLLAVPGPVSALLADAGLEVSRLIERATQTTTEAPPIAMAADIPPLELSAPGEGVDLGRILDASANRAGEGLRVVEDYARFVLDDPGLTRRIKEVRHRLASAVRALDPELLVGSRDTRGDVGTHIMTASERVRENPRAVLTANFKRSAEALRSLEEYSKLTDVWLASRFEVLRYDVYVLEKMTLTAVACSHTLGNARLMVLVGGLPTLGDLTWVVAEALAGGADVIQLREKELPDRELLHRAREVRILTARAKARFLLNDRPDLARLADADGVHLGQQDMTVRDARRIVGPTALIGVSTHVPEQIDQAALAGAGYLGVGPVFASTTKDFSDLAGLTFVRQASEATALPWFAIGGIDAENVDEVLDAGATRIAVSGAVVRAESPRRATAALRARLEALGPDPRAE
jgi:thiamine-phosphate pyrophosphorylase